MRGSCPHCHAWGPNIPEEVISAVLLCTSCDKEYTYSNIATPAKKKAAPRSPIAVSSGSQNNHAVQGDSGSQGSLGVAGGNERLVAPDPKKELFPSPQAKSNPHPVSAQLTDLLQDLHRQITDKHRSKFDFFLTPVDPNELPDYAMIIKNPIDLATIQDKITRGQYRSLQEFRQDVVLMCDNALTYHPPDSPAAIEAQRIRDFALSAIDQKAARTKNDDPRVPSAEPTTMTTTTTTTSKLTPQPSTMKTKDTLTISAPQTPTRNGNSEGERTPLSRRRPPTPQSAKYSPGRRASALKEAGILVENGYGETVLSPPKQQQQQQQQQQVLQRVPQQGQEQRPSGVKKNRVRTHCPSCRILLSAPPAQSVSCYRCRHVFQSPVQTKPQELLQERKSATTAANDAGVLGNGSKDAMWNSSPHRVGYTNSRAPFRKTQSASARSGQASGPVSSNASSGHGDNSIHGNLRHVVPAWANGHKSTGTSTQTDVPVVNGSTHANPNNDNNNNSTDGQPRAPTARAASNGASDHAARPTPAVHIDEVYSRRLSYEIPQQQQQQQQQQQLQPAPLSNGGPGHAGIVSHSPTKPSARQVVPANGTSTSIQIEVAASTLVGAYSALRPTSSAVTPSPVATPSKQGTDTRPKWSARTSRSRSRRRHSITA